MLLISFFLFSSSTFFLDRDKRKILFNGKYLISFNFTLASEQHADIICKSSGD